MLSTAVRRNEAAFNTSLELEARLANQKEHAATKSLRADYDANGCPLKDLKVFIQNPRPIKRISLQSIIGRLTPPIPFAISIKHWPMKLSTNNL